MASSGRRKTPSITFLGCILGVYDRLAVAFRPPKVRLEPRSTPEVLEALTGLGFETAGSYRYLAPLPVMRRFLGAGLNYRLIRLVHGMATHNRTAWLGEECIYHFRKKP